MTVEELREKAATIQGKADWIIEHAPIEVDTRDLEDASDELNYQVAVCDARLTGFGTKYLDGASERARRKLD